MSAENIMLTAIEEGVGTCCIGSIDRERLTKILAIPVTTHPCDNPIELTEGIKGVPLSAS